MTSGQNQDYVEKTNDPNIDQQGLDGVSVGGVGLVAPSLVRATSNTMISISRFRKRLSRSYLKPNDAFDRSNETGTRGIEVPSAGVEK